MDKIIFSLIFGILQLCLQTEELKDATSAPDSKTSKYASAGPKIIGGSPARLDTAKFMVSIREKKLDHPFGAGHICGGSLISRTRVLTAAHCFFRFKNGKFVNLEVEEIRIVMGTLNRLERNESTLVFDVDKYAYHESYEHSTMYHDLAMLSFKGIIYANNTNVQPINLTDVAMEVGESCKIMGWGNTVDTRIDCRSDVLLVADLSILDLNICKSQYSTIQYTVQDGSICAGDWSGGYDACLHDSGGPLICNNYLTGTVSWGVGCGKPMSPGVYTDIMAHRSWIESKKINLDSKGSYTLGKNIFLEFFTISSIYILYFKY